MPLTPQKRTVPEFLDLPSDAYGLDELDGTLADIRLVNRYLGDRRALLKHLSRLAAGCSAFTALDIATGSADLPMAIVDYARESGKSVAVTAVDINEHTVEIARRETVEYPEIKPEVGDALNLPYPDKSFDFVICSKTMHHMPDQEVIRLASEMLRLARRGFLILELRRSWIAYALISLLTRIFTTNRLTRNDGPLSVLKSFTPAELTVLVAEAGAVRFTVSREPFWLLVVAGEV